MDFALDIELRDGALEMIRFPIDGPGFGQDDFSPEHLMTGIRDGQGHGAQRGGGVVECVADDLGIEIAFVIFLIIRQGPERLGSGNARWFQTHFPGGDR